MIPQWLKDMQTQLDGAFTSRVVMDKEEAQQLINMCKETWSYIQNVANEDHDNEFATEILDRYKEFNRESADHT